MSKNNPQNNNPILSVSELNQHARGCLEMHVGKVWVTGEVSNFSAPASGHWYFTLKDSQAQIRCAMFKGKNRFIRTPIQAGMEVVLNGNVSIYEARGDYQMIVDYLEESGVGAMQRQFEQLKAKLSAQGLFNTQHKKTLPKFSQHIVVITSKTGAAIHDIISVIQTRQPSLKITLIPATVQGQSAANSLIRALNKANLLHQHETVDAVIIGRGGGSLEDLWAFNDEQLAQALFEFQLPLISAVGHEVDFSICDYVADARAATPSQAAEMISIDQKQLEMRLDDLELQLKRSMQQHIERQRKGLLLLQQSLKHPGERLLHYRHQFTDLEKQLTRSIKHSLEMSQQHITQQQTHFDSAKLQKHWQKQQHSLNNLNDLLKKNLQNHIEQCKLKLANTSAQLDLVSPLATLERGFSITEDEQGRVIHQSQDVSIGQKITTTLAKGKIYCQITNTKT